MAASLDQIVILDTTDDESSTATPSSDDDVIMRDAMDDDDLFGLELQLNDETDDEASDEAAHESWRDRLHAQSERISAMHARASNVDILLRRNRVLSVLCGFSADAVVLSSACCIQAHFRRHLRRKDKLELDRRVSNLLRQWRARLVRVRFQRRQRACVRIQAIVRGRMCRRQRVGRCLARMHEMRAAIVDLEVLVLRLSSMGYRDLHTSTVVVA